MLICKECGAIFSEEDAATIHDHVGYYGSSAAYIDEAVCPECGCDDLAEAVECDLCGEYADPDEMYKTENYCVCRECKILLNTIYTSYKNSTEAMSGKKGVIVRELIEYGVLE